MEGKCVCRSDLQGRESYLDSSPLLVKQELQGDKALYEVFELLLSLLHGHLLPKPASGRTFMLPSWTAATSCRFTTQTNARP